MSLTVVFLSLALGAEPATYPNGKLLIEPAELAQKKPAENLVVIDVRGEKSYAEGHVPGAIRVDVAALSKAVNSDVDPQKWGSRMEQLGIAPTSHVIVYGDDWRESARLWWILRYATVQDVRLLNGGWTAYAASGGPVSTTATKPRPLMLGVVNPATDRVATKADVLAIVKDKSAQIIDARSNGEFCGTAGSAKKKGAIPGAVNLEWSAFVDAKTQKLKPQAEIAKVLKDAGIDPTMPAVTYCQSGGRASVSAFVLELMGGNQVRNYYRSWAEWGNADDTPVVKPEK
jgi:thiosulfate/3-mercaptopyruvate sulfurtransferase